MGKEGDYILVTTRMAPACVKMGSGESHFNVSLINNNNNHVHLSCAHQRPERSHDTY